MMVCLSTKVLKTVLRQCGRNFWAFLWSVQSQKAQSVADAIDITNSDILLLFFTIWQIKVQFRCTTFWNLGLRHTTAKLKFQIWTDFVKIDTKWLRDQIASHSFVVNRFDELHRQWFNLHARPYRFLIKKWQRSSQRFKNDQFWDLFGY